MKCKSCKNQVPDGSVFCNLCGERLVKTMRDKKREISVPKARQLPSGTWFLEMQVSGIRKSVSARTEAECITKAKAIKAGLIEESKRKSSNPTLREIINQYIESQTAVLSPSTIREYRSRVRTRFQSVLDAPFDPDADWQSVVSDESVLVSPKTLKNSWGLVTAAVRSAGLRVPEVRLPAVPKFDKKWLDHQQIPVFIEAIKGERCELAALLGLHGLRRSEIYALRIRDINLERKTITVAGALVMDQHHKMVRKNTAKNESSSRIVPIMIPSLVQLLRTAMDGEPDDPIIKAGIGTVADQINRVCRRANLPEVGVHGLRHSAASLAHHLGITEHEAMTLFGYSDHATMHKRYIHVSMVALGNAGNQMSKYYDNPNGIPNDQKTP